MSTATANNVPLTKSQKKRMKRNKAKAKKAQNATQPQTVELDPLNAHDAMKIGLQDLGFDLPDINRKIDMMWEQGLDYSDINAVASFMTAEKAKEDEKVQVLTNKTEEARASPVSSSGRSEQDSTMAKRNASEEELKTVSTASFSIPKDSNGSTGAIASNGTNASNVPLTVTNNGVDADNSKPQAVSDPQVEVSKATTAPSQNGTVAKKTRKAEPKTPPSLKTKLDIVANNENLTDAIVALTEWIVKAATPSEIKELCDSSKPCALRTVIRRAIVAPGPRNFSGQLLDLIGSILRIAGIPSTELSSSAKTLMHTLTRAKSAIEVDAEFSESIANFVADTVTKNIYTSVETISSASAGASGSIERLEAEIESLKATNVPDDTGVGGLVAKRDQFKTLAQKHYNLLTIKMRSSPEGVSNVASEIVASKDEMMGEVFGDKYEGVVASKAKYDKLKKMQQANNSASSERDEVVSNIESLKAKKVSVSEKIRELEMEMKRLVAEEASLEKNIEASEKKLAIFDDSLSAEAKEAERLLREVSQTIKLSDSVSHVVESLQGFQGEMSKVISSEMASLQSNIPVTDPLSDLPPHMSSYITSLDNYFNSEYKLVSFLQRRAQQLRDGFPRLEMEIEECQSLGMTSNVVAMKKKLNQMQQNISDDDNIIKAFQKEAEEVRGELLEALKEYKSSGASSESYESKLKGMQATINAIL